MALPDAWQGERSEGPRVSCSRFLRWARLPDARLGQWVVSSPQPNPTREVAFPDPGEGLGSRDTVNGTTLYLRGLALISFVVFVIAGLLIAGFAWHRLPTPAVPPDTQENDGSTALAFVVFTVPPTTWLLWALGRRMAVLIAIGTGVVGFGVGAALFT